MKKSNKCDFKKLALLGIAGGTVLASQATASDLNNYSQLLAFNGCGGEHGCGHKGMGGNTSGNQAYRNVPSQGQYYQSSSGCNASYAPQYYQSQPSQGCQASYAPQYQQSASCHASSAPQYYQPSSGCQASHAPQYYQQSSGCHASSAPQYYQSQPSQGCGAASATQGQINSQPRQAQPAPAAAPAPIQTPAASNQTYTQWETGGYTADASKPSTQRSLSESELLSQLNDQGKAAYQSLDSSGKALALKLANQDCKGHNECKGLNSCKTEDHSCAGKGSCAGTAKTNFKDKNLAVKVAAVKMAEKRANAASSK